MARRIVPLLLVLSLFGYFGYRVWQQRQEARLDDTFYGTIEATETVISAQLAGQLVELTVDEGDAVEAGQLLARIDDKVYRAQLAQAQAASRAAASQQAVLNAGLKGVDSNLDRTKKLLATGSATEMQFDTLDAQRDSLRAQKGVVARQVGQAEAAIQLAETQLSYATIAAPLAGTVVRRHVELGESVFPGSALMTIADLSVMEVKIYVPGPMLGKIRLGQRVLLYTDSFPNRPFTGAVATIAEQAEFTPKNVQTREERVRLVYAVKVRVENPDGVLKIGMPVDARFVTE